MGFATSGKTGRSVLWVGPLHGDVAHFCVRRRSGLREVGRGVRPTAGLGCPWLTWDVAAASEQPVSPGSLPVLKLLERLKMEK